MPCNTIRSSIHSINGMISAIDCAKRALVLLIRSLAAAYSLAFQLTRDSPDKDLRTAFRKVSLKVHPDHGGNGDDQRRLNEAYDAWQDALRNARGQHGGANRGSCWRPALMYKSYFATSCFCRVFSLKSVRCIAFSCRPIAQDLSMEVKNPRFAMHKVP